MAATDPDTPFAVPAGNAFAYYINRGGMAEPHKVGFKARPIFDSLAAQLRLAVTGARAQGVEPEPRVIVSMIQGQADGDRSTALYGELLERYIARIQTVANRIWGREVTLLWAQSQVGGIGRVTPGLAQLAALEGRSGRIFGVPEGPFEVAYPSRPGNDYVHLTPMGYLMMGQTIGLKLGMALEGTPLPPIRIDRVDRWVRNGLRLSFSGLQGHLVADTSLFRAPVGFRAPDHLGFELTDGRGRGHETLPKLTEARISGPAEVELVFDRGLPMSDLRLAMGQNRGGLWGSDVAGGWLKGGFAVSPLRDSVTWPALPASDGTVPGAPLTLFAPHQRFALS